MSSFLDEYLIVNIVSRLPVESVLQCRCVCKSWRALLHELYFIQIHTDRTLQQQQHIDQSPVSLFRLVIPKSDTTKYECHLQDYYVKYVDDGVSSSSHKVISRPLHPPPTVLIAGNDHDEEGKLVNSFNHSNIHWSVIGSSNGLICLFGDKCNDISNYNNSCPVLMIYNPITSEYLYLPAAGVDDDDVKDGRYTYTAAIGFGYHPSTKEYKIVRIIHQGDIIGNSYDANSYDRWLHIYTLGSRGKWRIRKEDVPPVTYKGYYSVAKGAPVNGAIYWLARYDTIVSFDLEDEKFRIIQSPPSDRCHYVLGGERLCVVCMMVVQQTQVSRDIWVMNNINRDQYWWSKEFSIPITVTLGWGAADILYEPIAPGTGTGIGKDRVVCLCYHYKQRRKSLISFDPRTKTFKSLGGD